MLSKMSRVKESIKRFRDEMKRGIFNGNITHDFMNANKSKDRFDVVLEMVKELESKVLEDGMQYPQNEIDLMSQVIQKYRDYDNKLHKAQFFADLMKQVDKKTTKVLEQSGLTAQQKQELAAIAKQKVEDDERANQRQF